MLVAERLSPPLQVLAEQRLRAFQVALGVQRAEVADRAERARVPVAERLSLRLQRLAVQRLRAVQVALVLQQRAEALPSR